MRVEEIYERIRPAKIGLVESLWRWYQVAGQRDRRYIAARFLRIYEEYIEKNGEILLQPPMEEEAAGDFYLGTVNFGVRELHPFGLGEDEWTQHVSIFGRGGSGKTNLVMLVLWSFIKERVPFLVLDWKRNYRDLLAVRGTEDVEIFTVGRSIRPFKFNPWIPPPGFTPEIWMKRIIDVLCNAYFAGEGVMDVLIRAASEVYKLIETPKSRQVMAVVQQMKQSARQAQWRASALRILGSLTTGAMGHVTDTGDNSCFVSMLDRQTILELDSLANSDKSFLAQAMLLWIHQFRMAQRGRGTLKHAIVIEEAHHILMKKRYDGAGETIVEVVLREIRELGESVVLVDQHPSLISVPAIGNTYTTVCFNLKHLDDVRAAAAALLLHEEKVDYLGLLPIGRAIVKIQGRFQKPFVVSVPEVVIGKSVITDSQLEANHIERTRDLKIENVDYQRCTIPGTDWSIKVPVGRSCSSRKNRSRYQETTVNMASSAQDRKSVRSGPRLRMMAHIAEFPYLATRERYQRLGWSVGFGNKQTQLLVEKGKVKQVPINTGGARIVLLELTTSGHLELCTIKPQQSLEHRYWIWRAKSSLERAGYQVDQEKDRGGYVPDIWAEKEEKKVVVEVETGKSDYAKNVDRAVDSGANEVYLLATSSEVLTKIKNKIEEVKGLAIVLARQFGK